MQDIKRHPHDRRRLQGDRDHDDHAEVDDRQDPPAQEHRLPPLEEVVEGHQVDDGSLAGVAVVEEGEGEDDEAGAHHVVDGLVVGELELEGEQGLPEAEGLLDALLADVIVVFHVVFLRLVDIFSNLSPELDEGRCDLPIEVSFCLQNLNA